MTNLCVNDNVCWEIYHGLWDMSEIELVLYALRWNRAHITHSECYKVNDRLYDLFLEAYGRASKGEDIECIGVDAGDLDYLVKCLANILYMDSHDEQCRNLYNQLFEIRKEWL